MEEIENLLEKALEIADWIIDLRRKIHSRPELSFHENETAALVAAELKDLGLEVTESVGGNGVVGLLRGASIGKTVALRADIDALPINELNEIPYKSVFPNCMHACGHDGHTAMLLAVARLLTGMRHMLSGNVKFIFQPAEEVPPEGGAKGMIAAHVLENPKVDAIFALHIWPDLPAGQVGLRPGPIMAAPDRVRIVIRGKGGHGAAPHQAVDVIVTAAQIILGLQTLVSRKINPLKPVVLSICKINAGTAYNILPDVIHLEGTTRYFDKEMAAFIEEQIRRIVEGICVSSGCSCELDYEYGYPPTVNDREMTALVQSAAAHVLGEDKVIRVEEPSMTGEDFSYFLQKVPGCYFWLGTRNPKKGIVYPLHNARFQIDEKILPLGAAVLSRTVLEFLAQQ